MKTKNLVLFAVVALVAVLLVMKRTAVSSAPQSETPAPVTGRTVIKPAVTEATVKPVPGTAVAPVTATTPPAAESAAAVAVTPALASIAISPASEKTETEPLPAIADCATGRAEDRGLVANQIGNFPRVLIETNQVVPVSVLFPVGTEAVTVRVIDGGLIDGRHIARVLPVDGSGRVNFTFHAGAGGGSYRVILRRGDWRQQLQFWAGPPQQIAKTPLPEGAHLAEKL